LSRWLAGGEVKQPVVKENRFWIAMGAFVLIAVLAWFTLEGRTRLVVLAIMALFAIRTYVHDRRQELEERIERERSRE